MKQFKLMMMAAILLTAACTDQTDTPLQPSAPEENKARITETIRYETEKTTAYNFEYPSTDPYGKPCTLSGTITIGDEVTTAAPARGMVLYNHFTVYRADQCPSKGDLAVQKMITAAGLLHLCRQCPGQCRCPALGPRTAERDGLLMG